jgi:DNA-binding transcriptional LysR family regulator
MHADLFPPIASIRALEAAVRLRSFSAAAAELHVSQSAVSQAVRRLEEQLAVRMFTRSPGRVEPTDAGHRYAAAAGPALEVLRIAAAEARQMPQRAIVLGCSRALLNHWLLARLAPAAAALGTVEVRALERDPKDLSGLDVAVLHGGSEPPATGAEMLRSDLLVAVGAPAVVLGLGGLLEETTRLEDVALLGGSWDLWGRQASRRVPSPGRVRLREASALVSAARSGEGLALLPLLVCADDVRDGKLMAASAVTVDRGRRYWLRRLNPALEIDPLADWLRRTFREEAPAALLAGVGSPSRSAEKLFSPNH